MGGGLGKGERFSQFALSVEAIAHLINRKEGVVGFYGRLFEGKYVQSGEWASEVAAVPAGVGSGAAGSDSGTAPFCRLGADKLAFRRYSVIL